MSFLQPWALLLAGLVAVPLLLHLLRRQVVQRVAFPALRYLRNAERRTARSLRLRDLLLLATRVGLVLLLAVAAARPLAGRGDADDHAPTDVVLLVDNSASMSRVREGRTLLDHQLDAVRATLARATPADRFWVFPSSSPALAAGVDATAALAALDSLAPTEAGADLVARIGEATAAVPAEEGRVREVQLYTDRQASGFGAGPLDLSAWGRLAVAAAAAETDTNAFVADLRLEPDGPVVPGDPPAVVVRLGVDPPDARSEADTLDVRLLVDGSTAAMARTAPGSEVLIPLPDLEPGPHALAVELPPSGLRPDDARRIGVVAAAPPSVRGSGGGDGFLAAALATLAAEGRIREDGGEVVHVIDGPEAAAPGDGAVVLVPPHDLTRLPAFQQRLDALGVPWRLGGRDGSGEVEVEGAAEVAGLAEVRVATAHGLDRLAAPATEDDSVLLRTSDGAPWLVRGRAGGRIYLLLASPLHPDATDLPVSAAMVPFVERLVLHWSRPSSTPLRAVDAGRAVPLPPRIEGLRDPDGEAVAAEGGAPWTPRRAGFWTLLLPADAESGGDEASSERHVGVNVPVEESALAPAPADEIRAAFAGTEVRLSSSPDAWEDAVYGSRRGADATPWLVAGILLLALLELVLAAPGRRRRAHGTPGAA